MDARIPMLQTKFGVKAIEHDSSIEWCYAHNITQWHGPSEYNNEMLGALSESFSPCEGFLSLRLLLSWVHWKREVDPLCMSTVGSKIGCMVSSLHSKSNAWFLCTWMYCTSKDNFYVEFNMVFNDVNMICSKLHFTKWLFHVKL